VIVAGVGGALAAEVDDAPMSRRQLDDALFSGDLRGDLVGPLAGIGHKTLVVDL
jgi:hypothetical protein